MADRALRLGSSADLRALVSRAGELFDELAAERWPSYVPDWSGLRALHRS